MAQSLPRSCPHCGTEAISKQKFCPNCGSKVLDEAPPQSAIQLSEQTAVESSRPLSGPTANSPANAGPGSVSNAPAYSVPKRPSAQVTRQGAVGQGQAGQGQAGQGQALSLRGELPPIRVVRPTLEPLNEDISLSSAPSLTQTPSPPLEPLADHTILEPLADHTISSSPDEAIEAMPTQGLQVQRPAQSTMQAQVQSGPVPQEALSEEAIEAMPTEALYVQGLPPPSVYTQQPSVPSAAAWSPNRSKERKRVSLGLVLVVVLIVALGGLVFGGIALFLVPSAPSQPAIATTPLGTTVNYAGVDITVVNAEKSQSFLDDPKSLSDGMLRLQLRAQNQMSIPIDLPYETITHVTLPDGKVVGPTYVKFNGHMAADTRGSGLVDFAVPQNIRVDQVVFNLGGVDEAQLDIPLNGHANVDQYASKTVHPNQPLSYYSMNWTLTDASLQFHIDGQQASKGMRYLILTLKVDNPLFETTIPGSPYSYAQLKANDGSTQLVDTTLPVSFDGGATGIVGTLTFLVPQVDTSFVLTLSNPVLDGFDASNPVTIQF